MLVRVTAWGKNLSLCLVVLTCGALKCLPEKSSLNSLCLGCEGSAKMLRACMEGRLAPIIFLCRPDHLFLSCLVADLNQSYNLSGNPLPEEQTGGGDGCERVPFKLSNLMKKVLRSSASQCFPQGGGMVICS